jgi:succinate dehydrogenase hydrophobic anchor subunit
MFAASRTVYGRVGMVTPLWVWLVQRISAVFLGPLVLVHVSIPGAARNPWVAGSLLVVVLSHAYVGLWRLVGRRWGLVSSALQALAALLILLIGALGALILKSLFRS